MTWRFLSTRSGAVKPNASMLFAIAHTWARGCLRGLSTAGVRAVVGRYTNFCRLDLAADLLDEGFSAPTNPVVISFRLHRGKRLRDLTNILFVSSEIK